MGIGGNNEMSKEIIIDNIPNILSIIAIICGIISIKIARDSLMFSQRSMLIKESYEPILNDIEHNRKIKINSSTELNFERLQKVRESYLYLAFEDKDREKIDLILEAEKKINLFKKKSNSYAENSIIRVLNNELRKRKCEELVAYVKIGDSQGHSLYNQGENLYDILFKKDLSYSIATNNPLIWCETGHNYIASTPEGDEYESFYVEHQLTLLNLIEQYFGIEVNLQDPEEAFFSHFKEYEDKMVKELKSMSDYQIANKEYEILVNLIDELEKEIINKIKKLIIP